MTTKRDMPDWAFKLFIFVSMLAFCVLVILLRCIGDQFMPVFVASFVSWCFALGYMSNKEGE